VAVAVEIRVGESALPDPCIIILQSDHSMDELVQVGDIYIVSDDNLASARLHAAEYAEGAASDERPLQYLVVRTETLAAYAGRA
jgi:hypothetical protein